MHEVQVFVTEELPSHRRGMARIEGCLGFVATPSFPDDSSTTDENRTALSFGGEAMGRVNTFHRCAGKTRVRQ